APVPYPLAREGEGTAGHEGGTIARARRAMRDPPAARVSWRRPGRKPMRWRALSAAAFAALSLAGCGHDAPRGGRHRAVAPDGDAAGGADFAVDHADLAAGVDLAGMPDLAPAGDMASAIGDVSGSVTKSSITEDCMPIVAPDPAQISADIRFTN